MFCKLTNYSLNSLGYVSLLTSIVKWIPICGWNVNLVIKFVWKIEIRNRHYIYISDFILQTLRPATFIKTYGDKACTSFTAYTARCVKSHFNDRLLCYLIKHTAIKVVFVAALYSCA